MENRIGLGFYGFRAETGSSWALGCIRPLHIPKAAEPSISGALHSAKVQMFLDNERTWVPFAMSTVNGPVIKPVLIIIHIIPRNPNILPVSISCSIFLSI